MRCEHGVGLSPIVPAAAVAVEIALRSSASKASGSELAATHTSV
jgi:hypothetical protein